MSADRPALLTNLRPVEDFLASAHRYGVPLPFDVTVTGYDVRFLVHADEIAAWAEYLEVGIDDHESEHGNTHRRAVTTITYTDVPLTVACVVPAPAAVTA